jgi:hypothetical protein
MPRVIPKGILPRPAVEVRMRMGRSRTVDDDSVVGGSGPLEERLDGWAEIDAMEREGRADTASMAAFRAPMA